MLILDILSPIMIALFVLFVLYSFIGWVAHITMVKMQNIPNGRASYKTFKREFEKYNWDNEGYSDGLWNRQSDCQVFAEIVKFEGKGMIVRSPLSWLLMKRYVRKFHKSREVKVKW